MTVPIILKDLFIGSYTLRLLMQEHTPLIQLEEQTFIHFWLLIQQFPLLSDSMYLKEFAEISNFFWKGEQFQCITSIADYQKNYIHQVELEKKYPSDVFPYRLTDYKLFDISVMHDPHVEEEQLIYFVYNTLSGLPYRVVCPFPYTSNSTLVHYQILPLKAETPTS